jgi:hypothetical protein
MGPFWGTSNPPEMAGFIMDSGFEEQIGITGAPKGCGTQSGSLLGGTYLYGSNVLTVDCG